MALSITQTAALKRLLKPGMAVASMGYPDLIAPLGDVPGLVYRADSAAICKRHGIPLRQIPDAHSYFKAMGCRLDVYDIVQERGDEILCDLNLPMAVSLAYDIVLDVGTLEHCFNVAQAIENMARMVKLGGYIIHENPHIMGNHGFYGLQPTFYADFYEANGFKLLECKLADRHGSYADVPWTHRFRFFQQEINTYALARRQTVQVFVFPMQSKYKKLHAAAGLSGERDASERAKEIAHG